jgi:uncharacterized protein (DUF983 family)
MDSTNQRTREKIFIVVQKCSSTKSYENSIEVITIFIVHNLFMRSFMKEKNTIWNIPLWLLMFITLSVCLNNSLIRVESL